MQLASPERQRPQVVPHQVRVAANRDDGDALLHRRQRRQTDAAVGDHQGRNVFGREDRRIVDAGRADEHLRRPVEALQHAEQVGRRDDLGRLPRLDDAPALGPQRFAAHRRRVGRRHIEHGRDQVREDRPRRRPTGSGRLRQSTTRCSSTVSMCGVIRVARATASYVPRFSREDVEQVAEPLDAAGHAAGVGDAGLHEQLLLEHEHVADVHAERGPGAFGAVDRLIDDVRRVVAVFGHQEHAVLADLAQADRAHQQPADEAAFDVQAVLGLLVDVRGVDHVRVQHEVIAHGGQQPGGRRGVAGVTADGAVDAGRDQHHGVERVGAGEPALPVVEHVASVSSEP